MRPIAGILIVALCTCKAEKEVHPLPAKPCDVVVMNNANAEVQRMHSDTNVLVGDFAHSAAVVMNINTDGMKGQSLCKGTNYLKPSWTLGDARACLAGDTPEVMDQTAMMKFAHTVCGQK